MASRLNLKQIFDQLNRDYFCDAIIVDEISWKSVDAPRNHRRSGYYQGDRISGSIFLIDNPGHEDLHEVWDTVFHERLHQIMTGHKDPFYPIMHAVTSYWNHGTINRKVLSTFCDLLLDNILLKVKKGMLSPYAIQKFKSFPLFRLLMGESVNLCGVPQRGTKTPVRTGNEPMVRPHRVAPTVQLKAGTDMDWYDITTMKGAFAVAFNVVGMLLLGYLILFTSPATIH